MTFWFDTAHNSWTVEHEDDPIPRRASRGAFMVALIVSAGAAAATVALQILGAY